MNEYMTLKDMWFQFVEEGTVHHQVRNFIAKSWLRSRECGINPYKIDPEKVNIISNFDEVIRKNQDLIGIAKPVMNYIYTALNGISATISITDEHCNILEIIGDPDMVQRFQKNHFMKGVCWSESNVGTNAMFLCIYHNGPVQTAGEEQYCKVHHSATGSGAPIHDESGNVIGSINITSDMGIFSAFSLGLVTTGAKLIEEQIKLNNSNRILKQSINSMHDGMLVADGQNIIEMVNDNAVKILGMAEKQLIGRSLNSILVKECEPNKFAEIHFKRENETLHCVGRMNKFSFDGKNLRTKIVFRTEKTMNRAVNKIVGNNAKYTFEDIITGSPVIEETLRKMKKIACTDCGVLIMCESGTGKELYAHAIHNASERRKGPFVAINCAALPRDLVESELFGYEGGAFTGAKEKGLTGKFELADGGTLFLDEVGELPLEIQAKLLRVLDNHEVVRLGATTGKQIDVRVIAATNRDLEKKVEEKAFRLDLFYRINIVNIWIPPLRERKEDIPVLARHFFDNINRENGFQISEIGEDFLRGLERYNWEGNVRQLQNTVVRAYYLCEGDVITYDCLPEHIKRIESRAEQSAGGDSIINRNEKEIIISVIAKCEGNITKACKELGISRPTMYSKIKKYNIDLEKEV